MHSVLMQISEHPPSVLMYVNIGTHLHIVYICTNMSTCTRTHSACVYMHTLIHSVCMYPHAQDTTHIATYMHTCTQLVCQQHWHTQKYTQNTHCTVKPVLKTICLVDTMVNCLIVHFSYTKAPPYKDHLSTETTITWSLEWSL